MEFVHNVLGGNTNGTDEELGFFLDDNVNERVKLTLRVIVLNSNMILETESQVAMMDLTLVLRALPPTWGRSKSTPKGAFLSFKSALMAWI